MQPFILLKIVARSGSGFGFITQKPRSEQSQSDFCSSWSDEGGEVCLAPQPTGVCAFVVQEPMKSRGLGWGALAAVPAQSCSCCSPAGH